MAAPLLESRSLPDLSLLAAASELQDLTTTPPQSRSPSPSVSTHWELPPVPPFDSGRHSPRGFSDQVRHENKEELGRVHEERDGREGSENVEVEPKLHSSDSEQGQRSRSESPVRLMQEGSTEEGTYERGRSPGADSEDESLLAPAVQRDHFEDPPRGGGVRSKTGKRRSLQRLPFTLWDYLKEEVRAVEMETEEGVKTERVTNFLTVPGEVEKTILFGFVICLDSFLYTFTILPLRSITAFSHLLANAWHNLTSNNRRRYLRLSHKCDLTKAMLLVGTIVILHRMTDASKMYHSVRGQETIKLYVIFNVLEIADRLCCSFGQDLQDSLFSRQTLGRRQDGSHPHIRPAALFALNLAYVVAHSFVLFYQLVTLNVAINSYSNALLTLLLSNQFVEIKGSVFKKFEKENLFQITCADIVERFQLALMLFIIALRNLIELSSASTSSLLSFLPVSLSLSFPSLPTLALLQTIFSPAIIVLLSECLVDWLKHAFITKFNHIRPAVYGRFIDVLCKDLVVSTARRENLPFVDQSPLVSRRLGFAALPLGCLVIRVIFQAFEMLVDDSHVDECAPVKRAGGRFDGVAAGGAGMLGGWIIIVLVAAVGWAALVALKLLIGINLRAYAEYRHATMEFRLQEDELNGRQRPRIGVSLSEIHLEATNSLLDDGTFDVPGKSKGKVSLSELSRYEMVKSRVW